MEKKILRLLIVDDSPDDAELAVASLRKAGFMLKNQRVQDLASMQAALDKGAWDVVLSEYTLPHFGAQLALDLSNARISIFPSSSSPATSAIRTWSRSCATARTTWC